MAYYLLQKKNKIFSPSSLERQEIPFPFFLKIFNEERISNVHGLWSSEHQGHCCNAHCRGSEGSLLYAGLCLGISAKAGSIHGWCQFPGLTTTQLFTHGDQVLASPCGTAKGVLLPFTGRTTQTPSLSQY